MNRAATAGSRQIGSTASTSMPGAPKISLLWVNARIHCSNAGYDKKTPAAVQMLGLALYLSKKGTSATVEANVFAATLTSPDAVLENYSVSYVAAICRMPKVGPGRKPNRTTAVVRPNEIYFGPIDMCAHHSNVLSALRSDTSEVFRHLPLCASIESTEVASMRRSAPNCPVPAAVANQAGAVPRPNRSAAETATLLALVQGRRPGRPRTRRRPIEAPGRQQLGATGANGSGPAGAVLR